MEIGTWIMTTVGIVVAVALLLALDIGLARGCETLWTHLRQRRASRDRPHFPWTDRNDT